MPTYAETNAEEKDTYALEVSFTDEDGDALTPNSGLTWTLTDKDGTVINSRQDEAISEASTITIVLSGDDLAIGSSETPPVLRCVLIEGTFDSDLGSNLTLSKEVRFYIENSYSVS